MINSSKHKKKRLIEALKKSLGIVITACKEAEVSRGTYYDYMKKDVDFAKEVQNIAEDTVDFAESSLLSQIKDKNTTATIFYLKTKGKHRGYNEAPQDNHSIDLGEFAKIMQGAYTTKGKDES